MAEQDFDLSKVLKSNKIEDGTADPIFSSGTIYEIIREFIKRERICICAKIEGEGLLKRKDIQDLYDKLDKIKGDDFI